MNRVWSVACVLLVVFVACYKGPFKTAVDVDSFGAQGDGITWDHAAFKAAVVGAGVGGVIRLTSGKTYVLCSTVSLLPGQTLDGRGATIKRCPEEVALLRQSVYQGDAHIVVDDAGKFEVGMPVFLASGPGFADSQAAMRPIASIAGDTLFFEHTFGPVSFAAGAWVLRGARMLHVEVPGVTIRDIVLDGNSANHNANLNWISSPHIWIGDFGRSEPVVGTLVEKLHCRNTFGDCLTLINARNTRVRHSSFEALEGSAIHLSTTRDTRIQHNRFADVARQAERSQHADGAIEFSLRNRNVYIEDNHIEKVHGEKGRGEAIGQIALGSNRGIYVRRNTVRDTDVFLRAILAKDREYPDGVFEDVVVEDNILIDAGELAFKTAAQLTGRSFTNGIVRGNKMSNSWISMVALDSVVITDNYLEFAPDFELSCNGGKAAKRLQGIALKNVRSGLISGNTVRRNHGGIAVEHSSGAQPPPEAILIEGNRLIDQTGYGLAITDKGAGGARQDYRAYTVRNNLVRSDALRGLAGQSDYIARFGPGVRVEGNCFQSNAGGLVVAGLAASDTAETGGGAYLDNKVLSARWPMKGQRGRMGGLRIVGNTFSRPLPEGLVQALSNLVEDNQVDADTHCRQEPAADRLYDKKPDW